MPGGRSRSANGGPDEEQPGAPGPAQPLAAGGGGHVAADALDVHRELADALAGVEEEGDAGPAARGSRLLDRIDQAPVGPDVGEGGQRHPARPEGGSQRRRGRCVPSSVLGTTSMVAPVSSHTWSSPR